LSQAHHPLARPGLAPHPRWTRFERIAAGLTILDGVLGLAVWVYTGDARGGLPFLSLLALLAGAQAWRGRPGGHIAALAFYGLHLVRYQSFDAAPGYLPRAALNLGVVVHLPNAVAVINVFALGMFAASAALSWRRTRGMGKAHST
jgi:hypothetical protein